MFRMLAFLAGVITLCFCSTLFLMPQAYYWLAFLLALLLIRICNHFALFSFFSIPTYFKLPLNLIFDISILFLLGMLYAQWQAANQLSTRLPSSLDGSDATVTGTIISIIERRPSQGYGKQDFYQRFLFEVNDFVVDSNGDLDSTREVSISDYQPRLLQINNYQYLDLKSGQQWQFILRLKKPRGNSNPGGFDYLRYLLTQRIDATAYIRDPKNALFIDAGQASFTNKIRASRIESLEASLQQLTNKGLLKALLFGDRSSLNASDRALLQRTGTSHLLAISGLHIGVAALFAAIIVKGFLWLMPRLMHYWARSLIIALVALPVASFYAIVAGFSLSTRRALIMLSCFLLLLALRRQTYFLQTLTLTALLIVVIDPLAVLSAGFWFSFSAVAILLWAGRSIRFSADSKQKLKIFILAQLAIFIAMPLVLSMFTAQVTLLTPLANFVAIPLVSIAVVPAAIAGLLLSYGSLSISHILFSIADFFLSGIIFLLHWIDSISIYLRHSQFNIELLSFQPSLNALFFTAAFIAIIILLGRNKLPAYAAASIIWLVIFNPIGMRQQSALVPLKDGDLVITQLDVGQGSALLISTRDYHLLYDTGPRYSASSNAAHTIIKPYLETMQINRLDTIVVSHGDNDHSGGAEYLSEFSSVKSWLLGGRAEIQRISNTKQCIAGQQWLRDGIHFQILHPSRDIAVNAKENDQSCVLFVKTARNHHGLILFTGDISRRVEQQLVQTYQTHLSSQRLAADILIVPHHGSASSSSHALLSAVQPKVGLISAGHRNRYGHPNKHVVERYLSREVNLYRSDQLGAIQLVFRNGQWQGPFCAKYRARHFWQDFNNVDRCIGWLPRPV